MPTNANHHDDRARLERIDRLIETGEPGDDALLNLLRRHAPRPRPEFTARLEHDLLDAPPLMGHEHCLEIPRPVIGGAEVKQAHPRVRRFSVMAAAAIAIALLGVLAVIEQMGGNASPPTGAQADASLSPMPTAAFALTLSPVIQGPTAGFVPTASPIVLVPMVSVTATHTFVPTAIATATHTQAFEPTVPPPDAADQGIIWPSVRLVPVDDNQPPLEVGSRLAIYTRLLQFASWANASPGDVGDVLLTHQARIVDYLDYAGEYVIDLPADIQPVASWLLTNNAYFVYEVIATP